MNEILIEKEIISIEDLEFILNSIKSNEDCIINFPEAPGEKQDFKILIPIFKKIVDNASRVILIADPLFEVLIEDSGVQKVQFIEKPAFSYSKVKGEQFDEIFVSLIEKFWEHYFPDIKKIDKSNLFIDQTAFKAKASVDLLKTNIPYTLVIRMDTVCLKIATEKILKISFQETSNSQGATIAEILNLICGHLKPVLRKKNFEVNVQIGIPEEIVDAEKTHESDIFNWTFEVESNAHFQVSFYKEI